MGLEEIETMEFREWYSLYKPVLDGDGYILHYDAIHHDNDSFNDIPPCRIWSILDNGSNGVMIVNNIKRKEAMSYVVTERDWQQDDDIRVYV